MEKINQHIEAPNEQMEAIYESAIKQHPSLMEYGETRLKNIIVGDLGRIDAFEAAAIEDEKSHFAVTPEVAEKTGAIWVFSGPGTYEQPSKQQDTVYRNLAWTRWMDRDRLQRAAILARKIAEVRSGAKHNPSKHISAERRAQLKKMMGEYAPQIIYNGAHSEDEVLKNVMSREGVIFPGEKVTIIDKEILNTVDQMKTFELPPEVTVDGKEVALISHAPHLDRILHFLSRYRPFSDNATARLFPLPTLTEARKEYTTMEIRAILYYIFLSPNKDANEDIYPYVLNKADTSP